MAVRLFTPDPISRCHSLGRGPDPDFMSISILPCHPRTGSFGRVFRSQRGQSCSLHPIIGHGPEEIELSYSGMFLFKREEGGI